MLSFLLDCFAVNRQGNIHGCQLPEDTGDDATTAIGMFGRIEGKFATVIGGRACGTRPFYAAAEARGARVIVPLVKNATPDRPGIHGRGGTLRHVQKTGPKRWKKESAYHMQGRAENTVFSTKSTMGDRLRSGRLTAQRAEAAIACNALAVMTELGMPDSYPVKP